MIPTEEEIKNGWTRESLTRYIKERERANSEAILGDLTNTRILKETVKPEKCNNEYSPHRWRDG